MIYKCRDKTLEAGKKTLIAGILNVTPDSFSDGGRNLRLSDALFACEQMIRDGAQIIDVGGESTRPGYREISIDEELERIIPVIGGIASNFDVVISADTYKSQVAKGALDEGAHIINDIYGLHYDPKMANVISAHGAGCILMFNCRRNGECLTEDITDRAVRELLGSIDIASKAGIEDNHIITDPGIGFGTSRRQDIELITNIRRLKFADRFPVMLACSRKRTSADVLGRQTEPVERDFSSIGLELAGIGSGADILRVHNVRATADAIAGYEAVMR